MPRPRMTARSRRFFVMLSMVFALTACSPPWATRPPTVLTQIQVERQPVNLSDLHCPERPRPPEAGTQRDVAIFLLELAAWMDTCQSKLAEVKDLLRPTTEQPKETP